ncbi:oxidoreductase [Nesterenkonia sp. AN1]|nr:oxidoreductase [Nesterenkonia sp. AN1]
MDAEPVPDIGLESYRGLGRLQGRKALVTGGDSGIGAATAVAFAREGADVAIAYLPAEGKDAERVIAAIKDAGRTAVALPGDLMDQTYREGLVDSAAEQLGGLDILVNNAGKQIVNDSLEELTDEQVDEAFQINIKSMYTLSRSALKHMGPGSTIVNSTSVQAYQPNPMLLDYAATKAAINNFTKGLAQQLGPRGIRVNAVAPGPVWTIIQPTQGQPKEKLPEFGHDTPLGRPGQPVEMAPAFVFLASPESSYVSGETLNANGGTPTP